MESQPTFNEPQLDLSLPPLPDSCPLSSLLGTRVSGMTDEALEVHVKLLRSARESPQVLRALLAGKTKAVKAKVKVNLSLLGL